MSSAAQFLLRATQGTSCPYSQVENAALAALLIPASPRAVKSGDHLNEEECGGGERDEPDFKSHWKTLQTPLSPEGYTVTPALKLIQNDFLSPGLACLKPQELEIRRSNLGFLTISTEHY